MGRNTPSFDAGDETTCTMCEQFIEDATNYVSQNTTRSEVLAVLHQTCSKFGVFGPKCISMVDHYAPIIFLEIATISPKEFCQKISICSDSSSLALNRNQNNCDVCESAMLEIEEHLKDPKTKMKVIEMLLDGCKRVQGHEQECKKLVFEYGPVILTNLEKYLDFDDVCSKIHVCERATLATRSLKLLNFSQLCRFIILLCLLEVLVVQYPINHKSQRTLPSLRLEKNFWILMLMLDFMSEIDCFFFHAHYLH